MKNFKRILVLLMGAALILGLAGCDNGSKGGKGEVDFTSHNTNYSIMVRNNTGERLVAFKGDLLEKALIGGIPAHANNHGLPKKSSMFDKTEGFPLILLTEAQYNANKSNLNSQKNTPFTRVFVFYNSAGDNLAVYEIAEGLGGTNVLTVLNASNSINVELRVGGVAGETLGYAPAGMLETKLKMYDGNYTIFPVFKRYNKDRDLVETVYPKGSGSGYSWFHPLSFGEGVTTDTINLKNLLQGIQFSSGAAWVVVINQATSGGVRFVEGSYTHETATGLTNIMSGTPRTFQINMPKVANHYDEKITVSNWKFGAVGFEVPLQVSESDSTLLGSKDIYRDRMYTVTVAGDHNAGGQKAWISSDAAIPQNEMAGTW